ncbi:MAG TPA: hypothetical protein VFK44_07175 [Bacillales bacterium]|nr:hypothetical protein [Bacillales bacterium]
MYKQYKPVHLSPYDHPDIYPGPRPSSSFIFFEGQAHRIEEIDGTAVEDGKVHVSRSGELSGTLAFSSPETTTVRAFLDACQAAPVEERVPVLGYGSNVCLAQLAYKFGMSGDDQGPIVCCRATMKDSDIVFGPFLAPYGSLPAVIAPVKGAETEVWLTLLDRSQFDHMTSTEGGMALREHDGGKCVLRTGERFAHVYGYYYPHALRVDGGWVRFKDIPGQSTLREAWEADMLDWLKQSTGFTGAREHFFHLLRWDYAFHLKVEQSLQAFKDGFEHEDFLPCDVFRSIGEMERTF